MKETSLFHFVLFYERIRPTKPHPNGNVIERARKSTTTWRRDLRGGVRTEHKRRPGEKGS